MCSATAVFCHTAMCRPLVCLQDTQGRVSSVSSCHLPALAVHSRCCSSLPAQSHLVFPVRHSTGLLQNCFKWPSSTRECFSQHELILMDPRGQLVFSSICYGTSGMKITLARLNKAKLNEKRDPVSRTSAIACSYRAVEELTE